MVSSSQHNSRSVSLWEQLYEFSGEKVANCYQCGKCSAGCPLAGEMDYAPNQIIRLLQLGIPELEKKALGSLSIWLCLTCETCVARCPKEVDLPKIMDFLRQESLKRGLAHPEAKNIIAFHKAFLDPVKYTGRAYEVGLIADYKARSPRSVFQDVLTAPKLFLRGKLNLFPHLIKGRSQVAKIFERAMKKENKK